MRTDSLCYLLFQLFPSLDLELLGQVPSLAYEFCAEEPKQTTFRLDGLLIPSDPSANNILIHRKSQDPAQIAELLGIPTAQVEQFLEDATGWVCL